MSSSKIYVLGGGGFSNTPDNLLIESYVLEHLEVKNPRVCFIPTASRDSAGYIARFENTFAQMGVACESIALTKDTSYKDICASVKRSSLFYVGGGNTKFLLETWAKTGFDSLLLEALREHGKSVIGISAGALCWFNEGISDYIPGTLDRIAGLGLIPSSFCPHLDSEVDRFKAFRDSVASGRLGPGIGLDDDVVVEYTDCKISGIFSSVADKFAYEFHGRGSAFEARKISPEFLGLRKHQG